MWIVVSVSLPLQYSKPQQHKGVLALAEYAGAAIKNIAPSGRYIFLGAFWLPDTVGEVVDNSIRILLFHQAVDISLETRAFGVELA